jgi:hypothetical protein
LSLSGHFLKSNEESGLPKALGVAVKRHPQRRRARSSLLEMDGCFAGAVPVLVKPEEPTPCVSETVTVLLIVENETIFTNVSNFLLSREQYCSVVASGVSTSVALEHNWNTQVPTLVASARRRILASSTLLIRLKLAKRWGSKSFLVDG